MEIISLSKFITDYGNPRRLFMNLIGTDAREVHKQLLPQFIDANLFGEDSIIWTNHLGYTLIIFDDYKDYPILVNVKVDGRKRTVLPIDMYAYRHLNSSIIKNIMFNDVFSDEQDYEEFNRIRLNAIIYVLLYFVYYTSYNEYTQIQFIEGILLKLSSMILHLQSNALTKYRDLDAHEMILLLQAFMRRELSYKNALSGVQ